MSLSRMDCFAAAALQGLLAKQGYSVSEEDHAASDAVMFADALLAALDEKKQPKEQFPIYRELLEKRLAIRERQLERAKMFLRIGEYTLVLEEIEAMEEELDK